MKILVVSHVTLVIYELTGSDTRTCQSDGSWSGTNVACKTGSYIFYFLYIIIQ